MFVCRAIVGTTGTHATAASRHHSTTETRTATGSTKGSTGRRAGFRIVAGEMGRLGPGDTRSAILDDGGQVGGRAIRFFHDALLAGAPPQLVNELVHGNCSVTLCGDEDDCGSVAFRDAHADAVANRTPGRRVFIVLNMEDWPGYAAAHRFRWPPSVFSLRSPRQGQAFVPGVDNAKLLLLGNWWNASHENYSGHSAISLWLPWVSLSFAQRSHHTPVDLLGTRSTRAGGLRGAVYYAQRNCIRWREALWDMVVGAVNAESNATAGLMAHALGACNGLRHAAAVPRRATVTRQNKTEQYTEGLHGYMFGFKMEHNTNDIGYVTEKLADAMLAGGVPIYAGSSQAARIFNPKAFLQAHSQPTQVGAWQHTRSRVTGDSAGTNHTTLRLEFERVIAEMRALLRDPGSAGGGGYAAMLREEPLVPGALRRFFSWHPSVWPVAGDSLRMDILCAVQRLCRAREVRLEASECADCVRRYRRFRGRSPAAQEHWKGWGEQRWG